MEKPARRLRDACEPIAMHAVWSPTTQAALAELMRVRDDATAESLRVVLGGDQQDAVERVAGRLEDACAALHVTGRSLFAGLRAFPRLTDPYGRLWRAADVVREHRGDSHMTVCLAAGLDPLQMNVLTELRAGYPVGEYSDTRGWPVARREAALVRLEADGLVAAGRLTPAGQEFRDGIEDATDAAQA